MAWRVVLALAALLAAGCTSPTPDLAPQEMPVAVEEPEREVLEAAPSASTAEAESLWPPGVSTIEITVSGQPARGLLAVPTDAPHTLVVVAHGWGGEAASHEDDLRTLMDDGLLAVAMDYRGDRGEFKVRTGVEDTVAATLFLQDAFPSVERTLLYGWSMGGEVALLAAMHAPVGTYDYVFSGAGVMDLASLWHENPLFRPAIETETGGPPTDVPHEYTARSPIQRAAELATQGVSRVYLLHGAADSPVPVEHAERMYTALSDVGQPVSYYVVTKDTWRPCIPNGGPCLDRVPLPAGHDAGQLRLMRPFVDNRVDRAPDPPAAALRGTYDGETGKYEPKDTA